MNRHQVLTGAVNSGDHSFANGSIEGVNFTAYAAGCDIVILASDFQRVQIIPGATHGYIEVSCLACSTDYGKIAAVYLNTVCIFEPTPLLHHDSPHKLDYEWFQTAVITADSEISNVCWNTDGTRLLTGGDTIQLWAFEEKAISEVSLGTGGGLAAGFQSSPGVSNSTAIHTVFPRENSVSFSLGGGEDDDQEEPEPEPEQLPQWKCIWQCRTSAKIAHLEFSPDGLLFASAAEDDRLVKVWYENKQVSFCNQPEHTHSATDEVVFYSYIYLAHPRAVTGFSWRQTSKFMPRGSVANMLVTSCKDDICRIWVETILPDDGLVDLAQFDPLVRQKLKYQTHRQKHRIVQRLKHIKRSFHAHRSRRQQRASLAGLGGNMGIGMLPRIPTVPSLQSVHDFHKFGVHSTGVQPGFHFHLAASINPATDIPLGPINTCDESVSFHVHWLDNKELHFTVEAEKILQDLGEKAIKLEQQINEDHDAHTPSSDTQSAESHDEIIMDKTEVDASNAVDGKVKDKKKKKKLKKPAMLKRQLSSTFLKSKLKHQSDDDEGHAEQRNHVGRSASAAVWPTQDQRRLPGPPSMTGISHSSSAVSLGSMSTEIGSTVSTSASTSVSNQMTPGDALDRKIEELLRDWHQSPDMLFAIHPIDGSFLVWKVEWLDEPMPSTFRQATVTFSSSLPKSFPIPDAISMNRHVVVYVNHKLLDIKEALHMTEGHKTAEKPLAQEPSRANPMGTDSPGQTHTPYATNVLMLSKHTNGMLNLWHVSFSDQSKYQTVVSITHTSRVSGHRFRTNDIKCHPVLPLLLTTSHHNLPTQLPAGSPVTVFAHHEFCSELILWRVEAVGPLSKSGGIRELARISSPAISAFSNVAWLPTLLPSTSLGYVSNSASAVFVASDGISLRLYQAVIDARSLLTEMTKHARRKRNESVHSTASTGDPHSKHPLLLDNPFRIVSQQCGVRPGCIIQHDVISDAMHDWKNTQFLHIFQDQLVTGRRSGWGEHTLPEADSMEAFVDLRNLAEFEEHFFLVVIEKNEDKSSTLHMWRIVISSQPYSPVDSKSKVFNYYVPDTNITQEEEGEHSNPSSRGSSPTGFGRPDSPTVNVNSVKLSVMTTKVCTQRLQLPKNCEVLDAAPAAGHLSSSSIYPACFAPYLITTVCSDGTVRFWKCTVIETEPSEDMRASLSTQTTFEWKEWEMMISSSDSSAIYLSGQPVAVRCAYNGRVACAFKTGESIPEKWDKTTEKTVNIAVVIYECESTGGSEWILEDTIELKNLHIPVIEDIKHDIDSSYFSKEKHLSVAKSVENFQRLLQPGTAPDGKEYFHDFLADTITRRLSVPSMSQMQNIRRAVNAAKDQGLLKQSRMVQLDWVSTEDGSHILCVGVGNRITLYAPISSEIASANRKAIQEKSTPPLKPKLKLQRSSSVAITNFTPDVIHWMKLRTITLYTADGLPPLPMALSFVREGLLVVGMDNEMQVFSQWQPEEQTKAVLEAEHRPQEDEQPERSLTGASLSNLASGGSSVASSMLKLSSLPASSLDKKKKQLTKRDSTSSLGAAQDCGLFEAARLASPVLPQYHPKQMMELLNCGRIRRVKAILAHLVRCIGGEARSRHSTGGQDEDDLDEHTIERQRAFTRSRTLSIGSPTENGPMPETEIHSDYVEITSVPPLPLFALLQADKIANLSVNIHGQIESEKGDEYSTLFDGGNETDEEDPFVIGSPARNRVKSGGQAQNPNYFGPQQTQLLTKYLTYTLLPGLSRMEQMHLLAIADTVASTDADIGDRYDGDASKSSASRESAGMGPGGMGGGYASVSSSAPSTDTIDDCGLRFLLAMRQYMYLQRSLPPGQRSQLQQLGLSSATFAWALHSEAQEELLMMIPAMQKGNPKWADLREMGFGWWCKNNNVLRRAIEMVAKAAFTSQKEPLDAALYYLAMKKKNIVWGLFRSVTNSRMQEFFGHDFAEDRWRRAALKNAFALLGKQRFDHAAAFFLLGGAVRDAIEVCLNNMDDVQLALVIARLYEGDIDTTIPPAQKRILHEEILGCNKDGECYDQNKCSSDPFLRSMAYWLLQDYSKSLSTLLETNIGRCSAPAPEDDVYYANPSVFNFYNFLRMHPLIIRQRLARLQVGKAKGMGVILSGFTRNTGKLGSNDKTITVEDEITWVERRLYFTTAHTHFKAGCPALALEVLTKLPRVSETTDEDTMTAEEKSPTVTDSRIQSGNLANGGVLEGHTADSFDWSSPITNTADAIDWSCRNNTAAAGEIDWGIPCHKKEEEELKLEWSDDDDGNDELSDVEKDTTKGKVTSTPQGPHPDEEEDGASSKPKKMDIMAQQLKFIACLKIFMEELSTLATGFEVDGGQLRYQLYNWLEREVEVLRILCNYGVDLTNCLDTPEVATAEPGKEEVDFDLRLTPRRHNSGACGPSLHEVILADKLDFEAKCQHLAKRKRWLLSNQQLLRTLLSFCSLHGSHGGGLASVRMELMLLLQELQQEKTQQQLLSPLPFPTTLPLVSAIVASHKTVMVNPIRHLQNLSNDILHMLVELNMPPNYNNKIRKVYCMKNLAVALSACIYQSLCDSDTLTWKAVKHDVGMEGFTSTSVVYQDSFLMGQPKWKKSRYPSGDYTVKTATSPPSKWPGTTPLRSLLAREREQDTQKPNVLLCEAFVSVYLSLLVYALSTYDASMLYRLVSHKFGEAMWNVLFGGGVKKLLKVVPLGSSTPPLSRSLESSTDADSDKKKRVNLHMKFMSGGINATYQANYPQTSLVPHDSRPTYKESFVPPEYSMASYFMTKPTGLEKINEVDYDSEESADSTESEGEQDDEDEGLVMKIDSQEHSDPNSYSWCILRYAIVKHVVSAMKGFLPMTGLDLNDLPVTSPLVHHVLKSMEHWEDVLEHKMSMFDRPPENYIPHCYVDTNIGQEAPTINKYKQILESNNTPFTSRHRAALPVKRLWIYLVHQDSLLDIFVRYIFHKQQPLKVEAKTAAPRVSSIRRVPSMLSRTSLQAVHGAAPPHIHVSPSMPVLNGMRKSPSSALGHHRGEAGSRRKAPSYGASSAGDSGLDIEDGRVHTHEPMKIIHKEQDSITAFCVNMANLNLITMATTKDVQELDISEILAQPSWLFDETEYDILHLSSGKAPRHEHDDYLVVGTPYDQSPLSAGSETSSATLSPSSNSPSPSGHALTNKSTHVSKGIFSNLVFSRYVVERSRHLIAPIKKHNLHNVKRMASHPSMPYYLSGGQDGAINLLEWGQDHPRFSPRSAGGSSKITRLNFSPQGNKFGASDHDGNLSLWQVNQIAGAGNKPFLSLKCHDKTISDFMFVGSSSLLATAGHSHESKNVCLWDTLLPQRKALVQAFTCHDHGSPALVYAPQHQVIISGGKKGEICIFDVRQQLLRHTFQAHESAVKALALDPTEEFFVTGSAEGGVKVWALGMHTLMYDFPGEHARSSIFRNIGVGVIQLYVDHQQHLFSCGADGSLKVRKLPEREVIVQTYQEQQHG